MRVITVARKPITKSVAKNSLEWGCAGINIDASRTGSTGGTQKPASDDKCTTEHTVGGYLNAKAGAPVDGMGRWPVNVFLQHTSDCQLVGTRKVKGITGGGLSTGGGLFTEETSGLRQHPSDSGQAPTVDEEGKETVDNWVCAEGCPVARLDGQRGITMSKGGGGPKSPVWTPSTPDQQRKDYGEFVGYLDIGGVSRFFKQVKP
jgi:hypothetical protein